MINDFKDSDQEKEDIREISGLIIQDFKLEEKEDLLISADLNEFREKLQNLISYLLDNNFEKLLNAMYRLDVNEAKFREVLASPTNDNISLKIANLVIERELQKIDTRKQFREGFL